MDLQLARSLEQFDRQTNIPQEAYIELNNLYLRIERGAERLTIHSYNELYRLVSRAYRRDDPMREWWLGEFQELPGWDDV